MTEHPEWERLALLEVLVQLNPHGASLMNDPAVAGPAIDRILTALSNARINNTNKPVTATAPSRRSVVQSWVDGLSMMQQTVVIELARGPDGLTKYHISKYLLRWYRRCFLYSAMETKKRGTPYAIPTPFEEGGGSFTGPSYKCAAEGRVLQAGTFRFEPKGYWGGDMHCIVDEYIRGADEIPHHYYRHFMHGVEILGYKHPEPAKRAFWNEVYIRLARDLHLQPETEAALDERLGDTRDGWLKHGDLATVA